MSYSSYLLPETVIAENLHFGICGSTPTISKITVLFPCIYTSSTSPFHLPVIVVNERHKKMVAPKNLIYCFCKYVKRAKKKKKKKKKKKLAARISILLPSVYKLKLWYNYIDTPFLNYPLGKRKNPINYILTSLGS